MKYIKDAKSIDPNKIKTKTRRWIKLFCKVYHIKHVTPYIHAYANHLHQFYKKEHDIEIGVGMFGKPEDSIVDEILSLSDVADAFEI